MKTKEFSNGFKVSILKRKYDLIKFSLNIGAGFKHENLQNNGIAHYLEHVLILKRLETIYPYLIDFTTTYQSINLFFQCKKENLKTLLEELFDLFTYKEFDEKQIKFIEEEKNIIKNDINLYKDQVCTNSSWTILNKRLFPNNSKGLNYLGEIKNIDKINYKELIEWKNNYFIVNNTCLNFIGDIKFSEIEKILEDNFLKLENSKLELEKSEFQINCEQIIKRNLFGKYFYYGFNLSDVSREVQLIGFLLMNDLTFRIKEEIRTKKRDGYFNFTDINFDVSYLFFHIGSFTIKNKKLISIIKKFLQSKNFEIDENKFSQNKKFVLDYFNRLYDTDLLLNMSNYNFDKNSLNIFTLKDRLKEFTYNDFKNNLKKFFNLKQEFIIIE